MERMTLTEAMRKGIAISTQGFCTFVHEVSVDSSEDMPYLACAIGAAGIGIDQPDLWTYGMGTPSEAYGAVWPELLATEVDCPVEECKYGGYHELLYFVITHLNDDHRWSREAIIAWLDAQTLDLTPVTVPQEATV